MKIFIQLFVLMFLAAARAATGPGGGGSGTSTNLTGHALVQVTNIATTIASAIGGPTNGVTAITVTGIVNAVHGPQIAANSNAISRAITTFTNIAQMIAGTPTNVCYVRGYSAASVGGGFFELQPTNGLTTNMGWIFKSSDSTRFWVRQADVITPYQFGAKGDLSADETAAFNNAMTYAASVATLPNKLSRVTVPNGRFLFVGSGGGIVVPNEVELVGVSRAKSVLYAAGLFTNDIIRCAEKDDSDANTSATIKIEGISIAASSLTGTNIAAINLTGHRNSRIEDVIITGESESGPLSGFVLSDTNRTGGHESCFFNNVKNAIIQNVRAAIILRGSFNDVAKNSFVNLSIVSSNFLDTSGFGNSSAKLTLKNIYAASASGGADVIGSCPVGISAVGIDLEGYVTSGCVETLGITQTDGVGGKSRLAGLVVPADSILSLVGYTPILPDAIDDRFFISGLNSVTADSTTVLRVNGGVAQNRHHYSTDQENLLTVSNTGVAHIEYVYISTNNQPSGVLRLMISTSTNGSELVVAEVGVSSGGTIGGITNLVARQTRPRINARSVTTSPLPGNTNDAARLLGTNGAGLTVTADGQLLGPNGSYVVTNSNGIDGGGGTGDFKADGTVTMTGDINLGANNINNVDSILVGVGRFSSIVNVSDTAYVSNLVVSNSISSSGSAAMLIVANPSTNTVIGTNLWLDANNGNEQTVTLTNNLNVMGYTNTSAISTHSRRVNIELVIDQRGSAVAPRLSFASGITNAIGVASTNNAQLKSNVISTVSFKVIGSNIYDVIYAIGHAP